MDLLAGLALLTLVVASATIVALEAVLGRRPAPAVVRAIPARGLHGRAAHPGDAGG